MDGSARKDILSIVDAHGVIQKSALCRKLGAGWGTVGHHLRVMEHEGAIAIFRNASRVWIHLADISERERDLLVATAGKRQRNILWKIGHEDLETVSELSRSMAASRKVIRNHLTHLVESGIVERTGKHTHHYQVPDQMKNWIRRRGAKRWQHDEP